MLAILANMHSILTVCHHFNPIPNHRPDKNSVNYVFWGSVNVISHFGVGTCTPRKLNSSPLKIRRGPKRKESSSQLIFQTGLTMRFCLKNMSKWQGVPSLGDMTVGLFPPADWTSWNLNKLGTENSLQLKMKQNPCLGFFRRCQRGLRNAASTVGPIL